MRSIAFTKMEGSGNDFAVVQGDRLASLLRRSGFVAALCDRKHGIGADGLLVLGRSSKADARMRIFNADGSEAEMCGNGARCCAWQVARKVRRSKVTLETLAGLLSAQVEGGTVKLAMTQPLDLKLGMTVHVADKAYEVDYLNTGVPHAVIEVGDIENFPVRELGRQIRHHEVFKPAGTNVNFVQVIDPARIRVRTYERGVEDETLACGTGSVASAIVAVLNHGHGKMPAGKGASSRRKVSVLTRSGEVLSVSFKIEKQITDVWLEGKVRVVFEGVYAV